MKWLFVIWITGSIIAYFLHRWSWKVGPKPNTYTISDRKFNLILSAVLSWVWAITSILAYFVERDVSNKKEAKW